MTPRGRSRTFLCKRIVAGVWLALAGLALLNHFRELGIAGPYSRQLVTAVFAGMAIWIFRFGPSIREMRAHKRLRYWRENALLREQMKDGKG